MDIYTKDAINNKLTKKQDTLVSGTNLKTINGNSLLGSGDVTISGSVSSTEYSKFTRLVLTSSKVSMSFHTFYSLVRIYGACLDFQSQITLVLKDGTTTLYSFSNSDFINGVCNIQTLYANGTDYTYINGVEQSFSLYDIDVTLVGDSTEGAMVFVEVLSGSDY